MGSSGLLRSFVLAVLAATPAVGAEPQPEPDFYLVMQKCKTTVGYLVLSDESLKVMDGAPATSACFRRSTAVLCKFAFETGEEGHKGGNLAEYRVVLDSGALLLLSDETGGEYISIDTAQRAAVIVTRVVGQEYLGSKVCQGLYATSFDMKSLTE